MRCNELTNHGTRCKNIVSDGKTCHIHTLKFNMKDKDRDEVRDLLYKKFGNIDIANSILGFVPPDEIKIKIKIPVAGSVSYVHSFDTPMMVNGVHYISKTKLDGRDSGFEKYLNYNSDPDFIPLAKFVNNLVNTKPQNIWYWNQHGKIRLRGRWNMIMRNDELLLHVDIEDPLKGPSEFTLVGKKPIIRSAKSMPDVYTRVFGVLYE